MTDQRFAIERVGEGLPDAKVLELRVAMIDADVGVARARPAQDLQARVFLGFLDLLGGEAVENDFDVAAHERKVAGHGVFDRANDDTLETGSGQVAPRAPPPEALEAFEEDVPTPPLDEAIGPAAHGVGAESGLVHEMLGKNVEARDRLGDERRARLLEFDHEARGVFAAHAFDVGEIRTDAGLRRESGVFEVEEDVLAIQRRAVVEGDVARQAKAKKPGIAFRPIERDLGFGTKVVAEAHETLGEQRGQVHRVLIGGLTQVEISNFGLDGDDERVGRDLGAGAASREGQGEAREKRKTAPRWVDAEHGSSLAKTVIK